MDAGCRVRVDFVVCGVQDSQEVPVPRDAGRIRVVGGQVEVLVAVVDAGCRVRVDLVVRGVQDSQEVPVPRDAGRIRVVGGQVEVLVAVVDAGGGQVEVLVAVVDAGGRVRVDLVVCGVQDSQEVPVPRDAGRIRVSRGQVEVLVAVVDAGGGQVEVLVAVVDAGGRVRVDLVVRTVRYAEKPLSPRDA